MNLFSDSNTIEFGIETNELSRNFGDVTAVGSVTLQVPRGSVFGLLGVNGAGKTTLIKMLMGHLRPTSGSFRILGRRLESNLMDLRRQVGYVSEDRYLYDWMTVEESLRFVQSFYENWDDTKAASMIKRFDLPMRRGVRQLSRGKRALLCLTLTLSYNPDLIILDEPTSGLDPIVRRDFMENIISEISQKGKTVFFSSHIVEEIERIADYIGVIHEGKLMISSELDALKNSFRKVRFGTDGTPPNLSEIPGILTVENGRHEQVLTVNNWTEDTHRLLARYGIVDPEIIPMSLEEIFILSVRTPVERRQDG